MAWYCAHAILYVKFKDGRQDSFTVWENVHLIAAADGKEAHAKATQVARLAEGDCDGTFTWEHRPAEWVFAGIRKIIGVSHVEPSNELASGDELTYSEFSVPDAAALQRLAAGGAVTVEYVE